MRTYNGFWNGEPCTFMVVLVEISYYDFDKPLHWQNRYLGKRLQAIKVCYGKQTFYINNAFGEGYHKVTAGEGSPAWSHSSIVAPIEIEEVKESEIQKEFDVEGCKNEQVAYWQWIKGKDEKAYENMQNIRKFIEINRKAYMKE